MVTVHLRMWPLHGCGLPDGDPGSQLLGGGGGDGAEGEGVLLKAEAGAFDARQSLCSCAHALNGSAAPSCAPSAAGCSTSMGLPGRGGCEQQRSSSCVSHVLRNGHGPSASDTVGPPPPPRPPPAQALSRLLALSPPSLSIPHVVLYSDLGFDVSRSHGGQLLVCCEAYEHSPPVFAVVRSLRARDLGVALCFVTHPNVAILTSLQFSHCANHLVLGYGRAIAVQPQTPPTPPDAPEGPARANGGLMSAGVHARGAGALRAYDGAGGLGWGQPRPENGGGQSRLDRLAQQGSIEEPPHEAAQQGSVVVRVLRLPDDLRARAGRAPNRALTAGHDGTRATPPPLSTWPPPAGTSWPPEGAAERRRLSVTMEESERLKVRSPIDESNAALAFPIGVGPATFAYATKQGRVRLLEVVGRRAAHDGAPPRARPGASSEPMDLS
ncbi:hypothetical protein T492DRAFT_904424 [Pavlovales sp. CCMP2436]|nr:hypothetical protein T492DRAFT_904424 [Pavlovales sp. CCMP2436]